MIEAGIDQRRFDNLVINEKSVALACEDPITFAVNAAKPVVDSLSSKEKNDVEMVIIERPKSNCAGSRVDPLNTTREHPGKGAPSRRFEMNSVSNVLDGMRHRGIRLWVDGYQLRYRAPPDELTDQEITYLRARKGEVIEILNESRFSVRDARNLHSRLSSDPVPLTFQQSWLWNVLMPRAPNGMFTMGRAFRLYGKLNIEFLRLGVELILTQHEALRTRIVVTQGTARQEIDEAGRQTLSVRDVTGIPEVEQQAGNLVDAFFDELIDYEKGPLARFGLFKLNERDHILVIAVDHIISDGVSQSIILRDVSTVYGQCTRGLAPSVPRAPLQYADYAVWQQKSSAHWEETHGRYWAARLLGAKPIHFPVDYDMAHVAHVRFEEIPIRFGVVLTARLRERARHERTTLPMGLLAIFTILLARWCNTRDLVVPFNSAGRNVPQVAGTVGYFAHILHLRVELHQEDTFRDILSSVTKEYYTACKHDDLGRVVASMPEFVRSLWFQCDPPSIQDGEAVSFQEDIKLEALSIRKKQIVVSDNECTRVGIVFSEKREGLVGVLGYATNLFRRGTVQGLIQEFLDLCVRFSEDPQSYPLTVKARRTEVAFG